MKRAMLCAMVILAAMTITVLSLDGSDACTGFYVGSDVSESGNTIIGQTCDSYPYSPSSLISVAESDVPGRVIKGPLGFEYRLPDHTNAYVATSFIEQGVGEGSYGSGSTNDRGVAFTGSITMIANVRALSADPLIPTGLGEDTASWIVGACASSAKEAMTILAEIIDEHGSSESNIFMAADKDEAWYMEIFTGHQYIIMKLPKDMVAVFGNESGIVHLSDYETEYICSDDLFRLPKENGFAVMDGNEMNIQKTYASTKDSCHMRTWIGHRLLAPSAYTDDYDIGSTLEFLFTPDSKVSTKDLMELTRNRYEGTPYDFDKTGQSVRYIGIETMTEAHILEIDSELPTDMCITRWASMGPSVYSAYIPISSGASQFYEAFTKKNNVTTITGETIYEVLKMINVICTEEKLSDTGSLLKKDIVSAGIRKYMGSIEDYYLEIWPSVMEKAAKMYEDSPQDAMDYLNRYTTGMQKDFFEESKVLLQETLMGLASGYIGMMNRYEIEPMVDAALYSKRFGWSSSITRNELTLTRGDDIVRIVSGGNYYTEGGTISYNGNESAAIIHQKGDSFHVMLGGLRMIESKGEPTLVDYPSTEKGGDDHILPILVVAIASVALIAAFVYVRGRSI